MCLTTKSSFWKTNLLGSIASILKMKFLKTIYKMKTQSKHKLFLIVWQKTYVKYI